MNIALYLQCHIKVNIYVMEQEQKKINSNASASNPVAMEERRRELSQRIDKALNRIIRAERLSVVIGMGLVTLALWLSFYRPVGMYMGCKLILLSATALIFMLKSTIDLKSLGSIKNAVSFKEQLDVVARYRKRESLSQWLLAAFLLLYVMVDVLREKSVFMTVFAAGCILLVLFLFITTYKNTSRYQRVMDLENDVRELAEMEQ